MKAHSPELAAFIRTTPAQMWIAELYQITAAGTTLYLTDATQNVTIGGHTYLCSQFPGGPYVKRGAISTNLGLEPVTMGLCIAIQGDFKDAEITVSRLIGAYPGDTDLGAVTIFTGQISDIDPITQRGHAIARTVKGQQTQSFNGKNVGVF